MVIDPSFLVLHLRRLPSNPFRCMMRELKTSRMVMMTIHDLLLFSLSLSLSLSISFDFRKLRSRILIGKALFRLSVTNNSTGGAKSKKFGAESLGQKVWYRGGEDKKGEKAGTWTLAMMQRRRGCRSVTLLVAVALGAASALMSIQARPGQRKTEVTEDAASLYYYPPRVSFEALGNLEDKVLAAFEEEGMLLVDGVDDYRRTRENALLELERCVVRAQQHTSEEGGWEEDAIRVSNFGDGTKRYTIASSSSSQTGRDPSCLASTPEIATLRSMNERGKEKKESTV